jgi:hypothetical protein
VSTDHLLLGPTLKLRAAGCYTAPHLRRGTAPSCRPVWYTADSGQSVSSAFFNRCALIAPLHHELLLGIDLEPIDDGKTLSELLLLVHWIRRIGGVDAEGCRTSTSAGGALVALVYATQELLAQVLVGGKDAPLGDVPPDVWEPAFDLF